MKMKYKLSVVTTTYNQERFIEQCLKGIVNQKTTFPFQLIISDDGSTDNTRNIIRKYQKKYPDIIKPIFREKNLGPMRNFVETLNEAHTEYVALCDGDDYWTDNNKLQMQVDFLEKNKEYTICFHKNKIIYDDNSKEPDVYPKEMKETLTIEDLYKINFMTANTVVYRWAFKNKNSFKNIFPSNVRPGDYFAHLYHAKIGKIHYIDKEMSCYRIQSESMTYGSNKQDLKIDYYKKHGLEMINFYDQTEKILKINNEDYTNVKKWLIRETLNSAIIRNDKELISKILNKYYIKYPDTYYDCIKHKNPFKFLKCYFRTHKIIKEIEDSNDKK